jgi:RHS repeat-associated protein
VFGPGGQPIVQYEGSGTTSRRCLGSDERGSIVSATDSSGTLIGLNSYDEYGIPGMSNVGRFAYTGQAWLSEIGMQYSRARMYSPTMGRFMQTDPVGYGAGANIYDYVLGDPVNLTDPMGLTCEDIASGVASRICRSDDSSANSSKPGGSSGSTGAGFGGSTGAPPGASCPCISPSDPNAAASLSAWGGYFLGNVWVSIGGVGNEGNFGGGYGALTIGAGAGAGASFTVAKLNFLARVLAKTAYKNNPQIRQNIKNIVQRITGQVFTTAQIDSIMNDILNDQSTTLSGLQSLNIDPNRPFNPTQSQINTINIYIMELPSSPINNQVKRGWSVWRKVG